jgi:hypothetical protein
VTIDEVKALVKLRGFILARSEYIGGFTAWHMVPVDSVEPLDVWVMTEDRTPEQVLFQAQNRIDILKELTK